MKILRPCLIVFALLTLLTGAVYPAAITAVAQLLFADRANGSLVPIGKEPRGSALIGQRFSAPAYFWPRPSASNYSALPSGASNLGPTSAALRQAIAERSKHLAPYINGPIPPDLLLASGSGLDPHLSPEAALAQIDHVAAARHLSAADKTKLADLVRARTQSPQWRLFGAARVNVLQLNLDTDAAFGPPANQEGERP
jgi:potassium-transporting ATPase KdpC subunit